MSFHLLMSSSGSSTTVLWFWIYKYFASLVILILKYFIHYSAIVNQTVFLISFSVCLLLVFRNAANFCMLILCLTTLLNPSISSNRLFLKCVWDLERFLHMRSCHLQTYKFTLSFLIWIPFMSSSCLILARTEILYWTEVARVNILALSLLILKEELWVFHCWVWGSLLGPCSLTTLLTCFTTSTWTQNPKPEFFPHTTLPLLCFLTPFYLPLPASLLCFKQQKTEVAVP